MEAPPPSVLGMSPLVSIGVPVYNEAERIRLCLDSLLAQTHREIEILVSDNASTDDTARIVTDYAARDPRVILHRQPENRGMVPNFEQVRIMARGDYFMWAGGDDTYHPEFVAVLIEELERHPGAGLAMSATAAILPDGTPFDCYRYVGAADPNRMSPLTQALMLTTVDDRKKQQKWNLFFCGLYRKPLLDAIHAFEPPIHRYGDRLLPTVVALATGLRYVDRFLYMKHIHWESFSERNPNDEYVTAKAPTQRDRLRRLQKYVLRNPAVKGRRRALTILFLLRHAYAAFRAWWRDKRKHIKAIFSAKGRAT